ncbi:ROK family protein [Terriglobus saanensis]|uniref:ROK family protein n=1 Tax=Terriglobus saanensis (strain ATCC BAA-1853 / DSM 23119 / SP1PR4) TaxID=401053 RepID=E8V710_TERSS|nr:ROK family transcriptional regulator [Terriglobus saanensis]ADV81650.1 ROK family protein [Terriglobus saanensis SP1PR4]
MATSRPQVRGIRRVDLAYAKVASSELARDVNRDLLLEIVRSHQPVSRADLSRLSRLQPSTVSAIVEDLIEDGWVVEGGTASRPRGRRPTMLSINDEFVVLVADIRPRQAILSVVDLNGRFLAREALPISTEAQPAVNAIVAAMQAMREEHPTKSFVGVGISLPGRVDPRTQRLVHAPNLSWTQFDLKSAIQQEIGLPTEMDNAANASLLSELWFGNMDGTRDAVLVTFAEGVGAAILADGQLVVGRGGLAGEFGHIPMDAAGLPCGCGQRGCWETVSSNRAALRYYAEKTSSDTHLTYLDLIHRATESEAAAIEAIEEQARAIGRGLRLVTASLSPEIILIDGDIVGAWAIARPVIEEELHKGMLAGTPPRVIRSSGGELGRLRGAAAVLLQRRSAHHHHLVQTSAESAPALASLA